MCRTSTSVNFLFKKLESTCGTNLNAFAAGFADFNLIAAFKFRLDNCLETSAHKTENALLCIFFAGSYTEVAKNAFALVTLDGNKLCFFEALVNFACKSFGCDRLIVCIADKLALLEIVATAFKATLCLFSCLLVREAVENLVKVVAAVFRSLN